MAESRTAAPAAPPATSLDKSGRAIRDMFAGVAPRYDLLNHLLSGALDHVWRWRSARALGLGEGARVLDLCCGTGDQAIALEKRGSRVAAADFCVPMLVRARRKFDKRRRRRGGSGAAAMAADALALPFPVARFDGATVSFGLRNVADLGQALAGMAEVLRPGGRLAVLEFAVPENRLVRALYLGYFRHVLPVVGRLLSPRGSAYTYLPASVLEFPQRQGFVAALEAAGFEAAAWQDLTFGIVCLYTARRASR
jgi:demethylmenaquinone methyltransferase / 2-methoxy-6-polyprenyl-1,4-benzoquinol methylase